MAEDPRYHIRVKPEDVGKYVIIVGDRGRVERVAKYLEDPVEVGNNREYLTVTGKIKGEKVTVMSTGMGAPAVEICLNELATTNARVVIRVGTSGALQRGLKLGDSVIATGAIRRDGASIQYLPCEFPAVADFGVIDYLVRSAKDMKRPHHVGVIYSTDSYYGRRFDEEGHTRYLKLVSKAGALVVEMEVGVLYVVGRVLGLKTGAVLTVREELTDTGEYVQAGEDYEKGLEGSIKLVLKAIEMMIEDGWY